MADSTSHSVVAVADEADYQDKTAVSTQSIHVAESEDDCAAPSRMVSSKRQRLSDLFTIVRAICA